MFARLYTEGEGSVPELRSYYGFTYDDAPDNPLVQLYERWLDRIEAVRPPGTPARHRLRHGALPGGGAAPRLGAPRHRRLRRGHRACARALRARGRGRRVRRLRGAGPALRRHHHVGHHRARARAGRTARRRARRAGAGRRDRHLDAEPAERARRGRGRDLPRHRRARHLAAREVLHRAALPLLLAGDARRTRSRAPGSRCSRCAAS